MKKLVSFILTILILGVVIWFIMFPPSAFNLLPATLFEHSFVSKLLHNENIFIFIFDGLICIIIGLLIYRYINKKLNH